MERLRRAKTFKKLKVMFTPSSRAGKKQRRGPENCEMVDGCGKPSVSHATIVIFLEFFAWGLLTSPTLQALKLAFPTGTFLMNGIVQGVKGILSFLSAPLIGSLSDAWGRKSFLLLAVFFTCAPIPILLLNATLYFVAVALSGVFAVTFSIVFAYVADCTNESDRGFSYGVVSATFAASLVISPALGTYIDTSYASGLTQVVIIATMITMFNIMFIVFMVPESLPEAARRSAWGTSISWKQADPFASLRNIGKDIRLLRLSIMVFLSYLSEAGQYSCFFLYLQKVVGFSLSSVALFISVLCVTSVLAQTLGLSSLMHYCGYKYTIIIGLVVQAIQLFIFGVWTTEWLMWVAGLLAAFSTIIYPAISSLVSKNADSEQQGVVLGILTGVRGLCNGLGPAMFGLIFWLSNVSLSDNDSSLSTAATQSTANSTAATATVEHATKVARMFIGVPFLIGVVPVLVAILFACCIKDKGPLGKARGRPPSESSALA